MKIRILPSAMEDLSNGFQFYENQIPGLGSYFLETLFSDIDSLKLYAGRIVLIMVFLKSGMGAHRQQYPPF